MDCIYFVAYAKANKSTVIFWERQRQQAAAIRDEYDRMMHLKDAQSELCSKGPPEAPAKSIAKSNDGHHLPDEPGERKCVRACGNDNGGLQLVAACLAPRHV